MNYKGKSIKLGTYDSPFTAHLAYCNYARKIHGEFFNNGVHDSETFDAI
jgi:hypothetical protein